MAGARVWIARIWLLTGANQSALSPLIVGCCVGNDESGSATNAAPVPLASY